MKLPGNVWNSRKGAAVLFAALLTLATACGGGDNGSSSGAASVTIALPAEPNSLDPHRLITDEVVQVGLAIYERLMTRDDDGKLVPGVATEPPEQINETTWRFKIRPGIKFTNGEPLDAEAVAVSINRVLNPEVKSLMLSTLAKLKKATVVDDMTVDVHTDGRSVVVPAQMFYIGIVPASTKLADVGSDLIGSGPYQIDKWQRGQELVLKANPDYWGDKPEIKVAKYVFPPDAATRVAGVLSGEYDVIADVSPEDAERVPATVSAPGTVVRVTRYSAESGATDDVRVRQAMNHAIDTEGIIDSVFSGRATANQCQMLLPSWFGYNTKLEATSYDPQKAKDLIEEAGAQGAKVVLQATAGRYLRDRELSQAVVQYWKDVGLDASVQFLSSTKYLDTIYDESRTPSGGITLEHNNGLSDADLTVSNFYAPSADLSANDNELLEDLVKSARSEMDPAKRQAMYEEITQIGCDEALFDFGVSPDDIYGLTKRVTFKPRADSFIVPTNIGLKK